ncbi:hypothetical protein GCM10027416_19030 [Okibacterium endophyticum]
MAIGTTAALGLGGMLVATPAFANESEELAPLSGSQYKANAFELLGEDGVQAVAQNADGQIVVVKTVDSDVEAVDEFDERYANVVIKEVSSELRAYDTNDVVGGAGYFTRTSEDALSGSSCSIGFTAWTPAGDPAVVTAGHCTDNGDNTVTDLTLPTSDIAGGAPEGSPVVLTAALGTFGFSQHGGPDNTIGTNDLDSIDVAVIDVANGSLNLEPEVTDWSTTADLSESTTTITSVGSAQINQPVAKSGRTTGNTTGTVTEVNGWAEIGDRIVYGFGSELVGGPGDSGGAVYQGNTAVGILSGGSSIAEGDSENFIWASDLQNSLAHTGGYTLQLHVDAPVLTSPADGGEVQTGAAISGTGPASTTIVVTPTGAEAFEITTDASGNWSFPAPGATGPYSFSIFAKNGFNESTVNEYALDVVPAPLTAPVITNPADGSDVVTEVTEITGTGRPGATVTVSGDVEGTAVVGSDGTWSIETDLGYGSYEITVVQALDGETSPAATAAFDVVLQAPVITSPADGAEFAADAAPTTVTGTGVEGATVTAAINGVDLGSTTAAEDGAWELALAAGVQTGTNTIAVTQSIDGVSSSAQVSFVVAAAPAPAPAPAGSGTGSGDLAETGAEFTPALGLAAMMLLAAGASLVVIRNRKSAASQK